MRLKLIFIGLLIASPAVAQQPQIQPTEYNLKITPQELDLLAKALGLMPYNEVVPMFQKLRSQIVEQQSKQVMEQQQPKKAEEPKK